MCNTACRQTQMNVLGFSCYSFLEADVTAHTELSVQRRFFIDSWSHAGAVEGGGALTVNLNIVWFVH